jgi:polyisoprenoid-binding protein YceI
MKKLSTLVLILFVAFQFTACKSDSKEAKKETKVEKKSTAAYVLSDASNSINWIAYKTTDKVAVKGKFKKVDITSGGEGNTVKEAINNADFSIPLSSIFTNDSSRDYKIRKSFFGAMLDTELLSGKLVIENDSLGYADIKMNGVTKKLPFAYTIVDKKFEMNAVMELTNWNADAAIASLNAVCKDLHKGTDGVSKTWTEVAINISSTFK